MKFSKLKQLPIQAINFSDSTDVTRYERMVALVERMLDLHCRQAVARTWIAATDRESDQLEYELCGLTEEEIVAVEAVNSPLTETGWQDLYLLAICATLWAVLARVAG